MKPLSHCFAWTCMSGLITSIVLTLQLPLAAASQTWLDPSADNQWNTTTGLNWAGGVAWTQGNSAVFGGTAETVTLGEAITTSGLRFNSGTYTLTGQSLSFTPGAIIDGAANAVISSPIAGSGKVAMNGGGIVTFNQAGTQSFAGNLEVNSGALEFASGFNLSGGTGITLNGGRGLIGGTGYPFRGLTRGGTLILRGTGDQLGAQTVTMNNGTLMWRGSGANTAATVQNVHANSGHNVIALAPSGGANFLTVNQLTRTPDSTVEFRASYAPLGTTGEARLAVGTINGSAPVNVNGILGGWAFAAAVTTNAENANQARSFAAWDGNLIVSATPDRATGGAGGTALNQSLTSGTATENWLVNGAATDGNSTLTANTAIHSLIASSDVVINTGTTLTLASGGLILRESSLWMKTNTGAKGTLTSGLASGHLYVQNDGGGGDQAIRVFIADNGPTAVKLVKSGSGVLKLDQINPYSGGTVVNQGTLRLEGTGGANGIIRGTATVNAGATLQLATGDATGHGGGASSLTAINLNGGNLDIASTSNQTLGNAVINLTGGSITGIANSNLDFFRGSSALNSLASNVTSTIQGVALSPLRQGSTTFNVEAGTTSSGIDLDIQSVIRTSPGGSAADSVLIKAGAGTVAFSGANTIANTNNNSIRIDDGVLMVGNGGTSGTLGGLNVLNQATLAFNRSDNALIVNNQITGSGNLEQRGTGVTTLTAANSYSGATTVTAGTLLINGSHSGTGLVTVGLGATLGGSGSLAAAVNVSGQLSPGSSIESLATGNLTLGATSTLNYEFDSGAGLGDLIAVSGNLQIDSGAVLTLTDLAAGALAGDTKLTLISYTGDWASDALFTYEGTLLADDSTLTVGNNTWRFNYNDEMGGSNFVPDQVGAVSFVTLTAIPEPSAVAMIGAFGMLAMLRKRRS
jgi:fibronectin-binding autotransporter adhesin